MELCGNQHGDNQWTGDNRHSLTQKEIAENLGVSERKSDLCHNGEAIYSERVLLIMKAFFFYLWGKFAIILSEGDFLFAKLLSNVNIFGLSD